MTKSKQKTCDPSTTLGKRPPPGSQDEGLNPSKSKKAKVDVGAGSVFSLITQLTKLEKQVTQHHEELTQEIFKLKKVQEQFSDDLKKVDSIHVAKVSEIAPDLVPKLQVATTVSESVGVQVEEHVFEKEKLPAGIQDLLEKSHQKVKVPNKVDDEFVPDDGDSSERKAEIKAAKRSGKGSKPEGQKKKTQLMEPFKDCTDRHQILKCLRTGKRFGAFTDEQLLHMTDPGVLAKLEGTTQPQKIQQFLKNSVFYGFTGKLTQPILCTIFQQFKISQGKGVKNLKIVDKKQITLGHFMEVQSFDSQQNEIYQNLENKIQNMV